MDHEACLPVSEVAYDREEATKGNISWMTAEQYLAFVHDQSQQLPAVSRADLDTSVFQGRQTKYMPEIEHILESSGDLLPSKDWEVEVLRDFEALRQNILEKIHSGMPIPRKIVVPAMKDELGWFKICSGASETLDLEEDSSDEESSASPTPILYQIEETDSHSECEDKKDQVLESYLTEESITLLNQRRAELSNILSNPSDLESDWEQHAPSLSLILQFDQVMTQKVLQYNISWLEKCRSFSERRVSWIYALLARLDMPLFQDTVAALRQLYRVACKLRARLKQTESKNPEEHFEYLARLNLLIVISGRFFGQGEIYSEAFSVAHQPANDNKS